MVAANKMYFAIQRLHDLAGMCRCNSSKHISNYKYMVVTRNLGIPLANQLCFHLFHVFERPAVKRDHILMPKMKIRNKVYFGHAKFLLVSKYCPLFSYPRGPAPALLIPHFSFSYPTSHTPEVLLPGPAPGGPAPCPRGPAPLF